MKSGILLIAACFCARSTLALQATGFFPANGATQVCADVPLRIHFDQGFTFQYQGTVKVYNAANDQLVYTLNLGQTIPTSDTANQWPFHDTIGGTSFNYYPVLVQGHDAVIQLKRNLFQYGGSYYVTVDAGIFHDSGGGAFAAISADQWRFQIAAAAPARGADLVIAADGSGDFCTVQGALDYVPANNNTAIRLTIQAGYYEEIVNVANKNKISLIGADENKCTIAYPNNDSLNASTRTRAVFTAQGNDLTFQNLTITNLTPKGGSQAEALALWGDRCVIDLCHFVSFQDTLLVNGRVYFLSCLVEGDVDFIWGTGAVYFDQCTIKSLNKGYVVQARNGQGMRGYVFVQCDLTGASSAAGSVLARTAGDTYLYSEVVYIDCNIGSQITPLGWLISLTDPSKIFFAEYGSLDANGNVLNVSQRDPNSKQLTAAQANQYRSIAFVLGGTDNWTPVVPSLPVGIEPGGSSRPRFFIPASRFRGLPTNLGLDGRWF